MFNDNLYELGRMCLQFFITSKFDSSFHFEMGYLKFTSKIRIP